MSPSNEHNGYNGRAVDWHYGDKIGTVAVIPAYNEERFIGSVVIKACKYADAVIVVDDGSSDATAEIARLAGATVIQHEQNAGKGAALSTGLRKARELHPAAVVVLDADYQHRPREIGQVTAPVLAGEADIVIGSRYLSNGSNTPTHRVWGHRVFNLMTNGASGVAVTDSQSGFRAFSPARAGGHRLPLQRLLGGVGDAVHRQGAGAAAERGADHHHLQRQAQAPGAGPRHAGAQRTAADGGAVPAAALLRRDGAADYPA
jgi:hypothetical protein